jgi:hypothetical protein
METTWKFKPLPRCSTDPWKFISTASVCSRLNTAGVVKIIYSFIHFPLHRLGACGEGKGSPSGSVGQDEVF